MRELTRQAWLGLAKLVAILVLCLFLPAWSFDFWEAWTYVGAFGASVAAITWYLQKQDPELLQRRLAAGPAAETERRQKVIQAIASIAFAGIFLVAGLDDRLGWSNISVSLVLAGDPRVLTRSCAIPCMRAPFFSSSARGVREAESLAPLPDGFVRDRDAAMREEVFDVAEAQGEAVVEPNGVAGNGGREWVARIADNTAPQKELRLPSSATATTTNAVTATLLTYCHITVVIISIRALLNPGPPPATARSTNETGR